MPPLVLPVCFNSAGDLLPCTNDFIVPDLGTLLGSWSGTKIYDREYIGIDTCYDDEVSVQLTPYVSSGPQLRTITTRRSGAGIEIVEFNNNHVEGGYSTNDYISFTKHTTYTLLFDSYGNAEGEWSEGADHCYGTWSLTKD